MSTSEPPELPEPEVEFRRPAWVEPPADMLPGIVPVELVLVRTPQRAIGLTGIRAYPTGFTCTLHLRLRQVIPGEQSFFGIFGMFDMLELDPAGELADYYLRDGQPPDSQVQASRLTPDWSWRRPTEPPRSGR